VRHGKLIFGYKIVKDPVHIDDTPAALNCLGIDQERTLQFRAAAST
jgi:hypothetical protein